MSKKIVIIGGGPAGYVAAIRAAQLGAEVHLVEKGALGGTCLNVGCIPTKALLHTGEFYHKAQAALIPGVKSHAELDWPAALGHKDAIVKRLTGGVSWLLKENKVQVYQGNARLLPGLRVQAGDATLSADAILLATGSVNAALSFPGCDLEGILDSTAALSLYEPPASIAIVGGGVIGIEFATLFSHLGAEVAVIEMMPEILPALDGEIAAWLRKKLEASRVKVLTGTGLAGVEKADKGYAVHITANGLPETLRTEKVLVAVGRKPNTAGLGLEGLGVAMDRSAITVDEDCQTSIPGLYAIGDCNGKIMLAHAAMAQGICAVAHIMGAQGHVSRKYIPSCVYSSPEIASVGLTEKQLQEKGIPYAVGRFPLAGNGKAAVEGEEGLIKILADQEFGEVLGVHMIGPKVTEMIAEATICMNMEGTAEDIANTVHAHPSINEAVGEAAMAVLGKAIHGI